MVSGRLTELKIRKAAPGKYGDGSGLWLTVRPEGHKAWTFRFLWQGRGREMGLGPEQDVSLAAARELTRQMRKLVRDGIDPIAQRREKKRADQTAKTFSDVADLYIAAHEASWKNAKHRAQWRNTLDTYVVPVFGKDPVASIQTGDISKVIEPLWKTKSETASRVRGRIERILDYATAQGWRTGDNPARWSGHLKNTLPDRTKVAKVEHHAALPWADIAKFMAALEKQPGTAALALQFTILTAARTGEVIGACWGEIDLKAKIWTVPAERMKAGREHRVPLTDSIIKILEEVLPQKKSNENYVFPSSKPKKPLSNMAMAAVLKRMKRNDITVHGFRSTFRDWASESTDFPREVAEAALAHGLKDKVEAAYRRGDLFEKRTLLMKEWNSFCAASYRERGKNHVE